MLYPFIKALLILIASSLPLALSRADERPNIIIILCDDLGYGDLSCYGNTVIRTPNIDQLASEGIRFTSFYSSSPVCSPSRVGLMTGRTPDRAGVYDWIPKGNRMHMSKNEFTMPVMLKKTGYATCMSGKWHCNGLFNQINQPQPGDFGFDHWFATQNNAAPSHEDPENFVRNGKSVGMSKGFSCQIVAQESVNWITGHVKKNPDQPFFSYVAFHEPHEPIASPKNLINNYPNAKKRGEALYYANVENMDSAVGQITRCLDRLNITKNTLVIFSSDNGPETLNRYRSAWRSHGSPGPLRGMKLHTHEAGIRVAGIMRWPIQIKAKQVSDAPVSALDLLPTFASLAAGEIPIDLKLDGADIVNAFGGSSVQRKQPLFWCYYSSLNKAKIAIRDGEWKLLASLKSSDGKNIKARSITEANRSSLHKAQLGDFELYKISKDISEKNNLSDKYPKELNSMAKKMKSIYKDVVQDAKTWQ
ncbi:MAG: sulfatase-like hydrolase/transferase [Verrucomicrobiales bacterium]|nr:MAG: arylsulfatase [Verrucomicrobiaceae bacterium]